jgi:hypothetical protein
MFKLMENLIFFFYKFIVQRECTDCWHHKRKTIFLNGVEFPDPFMRFTL